MGIVAACVNASTGWFWSADCLPRQPIVMQMVKFMINVSDQIGGDDRYAISSYVPIFLINNT